MAPTVPPSPASPVGPPPPGPRNPHGRREAGFSLLETLIAAALLMLILIGILPLFERSRMNLLQGFDASRVSNATIENTERLIAAPFNGFLTNLGPDGGGGATNALERTDFWLLEGNTWADTVPAGDRMQFQRDVTIEQFGVGDVTNFDANIFETPLGSDTAPTFVHMKRFTTEIRNARMGDSAPYRIVAVQTY